MKLYNKDYEGKVSVLALGKENREVTEEGVLEISDEAIIQVLKNSGWIDFSKKPKQKEAIEVKAEPKKVISKKEIEEPKIIQPDKERPKFTRSK